MKAKGPSAVLMNNNSPSEKLHEEIGATEGNISNNIIITEESPRMEKQPRNSQVSNINTQVDNNIEFHE